MDRRVSHPVVDAITCTACGTGEYRHMTAFIPGVVHVASPGDHRGSTRSLVAEGANA